MMPSLTLIALLVTSPGEPPPAPGPELGPEEVVWIQIEALRDNDKRGKDAGIATVFKFASPSNQSVTGPVDHFAEIVKGPAYRPMLGHRVAGVGRMIVVDNVALQRATIVAADGRSIEYEFRLSKDPRTKCWGTDGVVPVGEMAKPPSPVI